MTDELRAAAEQMISTNGEVLPAFSSLVEICRAYLAENLPDDGEAATPQWMESLGFVETYSFAWRFGINERIYFHHDANVTQIGIDGAWHLGIEGAWHRVNPTRGDVRRLAKALGVELKEGG